LVQTAVAGIITGVVLTGGWMTFADMRAQWHIAAAERMMDQYAAAAMQELTNDLSWSWGGKRIQAGALSTRWQFVMNDVTGDEGGMARWRYATDPANFITLTVRPMQGILINGVPPKWSVDRYRTQYLWSGSSPRRGTLKTFDRRDRMTVESFTVDFQRYPQFPGSSDPLESVKRQGPITVELVMHYTSSAKGWNSLGPRMHDGRYVRERRYSTEIFMRNWDVESNTYRDNLLHAVGGGAGG